MMQKDICPNCFGNNYVFESKYMSGRCLSCGYRPQVGKFSDRALLPKVTLNNGKYILGRVLGEGGFGITYKAVDLFILCYGVSGRMESYSLYKDY